MDEEDLMVGGEDLDYEEYDLDEEEEKALLEEQVEEVEEHTYEVYDEGGTEQTDGQVSHMDEQKEDLSEDYNTDNGRHEEQDYNAADENTQHYQEPHDEANNYENGHEELQETNETFDEKPAEIEEEEEEEDEDAEGGRDDRFRSERAGTSSVVSLKSGGSRSNIPDTLDEVVTPNIPNQGNHNNNNQQKRRGGGRNNRRGNNMQRGAGNNQSARGGNMMIPPMMQQMSPMMNMRMPMRGMFSPRMPFGYPDPNMQAFMQRSPVSLMRSPLGMMRSPFGSNPGGHMRSPQLGPMFVGAGSPRMNMQVGPSQQCGLMGSRPMQPQIMNNNNAGGIRRTPPQQRISRPGLKQVNINASVKNAPSQGTKTSSAVTNVSAVKTTPTSTNNNVGTKVATSGNVTLKRQSTGGAEEPAAKQMKVATTTPAAAPKPSIHSRLSNVKPVATQATATKAADNGTSDYEKKLAEQKKMREEILAKKAAKRKQQTATAEELDGKSKNNQTQGVSNAQNASITQKQVPVQKPVVPVKNVPQTTQQPAPKVRQPITFGNSSEATSSTTSNATPTAAVRKPITTLTNKPGGVTSGNTLTRPGIAAQTAAKKPVVPLSNKPSLIKAITGNGKQELATQKIGTILGRQTSNVGGNMANSQIKSRLGTRLAPANNNTEVTSHAGPNLQQQARPQRGRGVSRGGFANVGNRGNFNTAPPLNTSINNRLSESTPPPFSSLTSPPPQVLNSPTSRLLPPQFSRPPPLDPTPTNFPNLKVPPPNVVRSRNAPPSHPPPVSSRLEGSGFMQPPPAIAQPPPAAPPAPQAYLNTSRPPPSSHLSQPPPLSGSGQYNTNSYYSGSPSASTAAFNSSSHSYDDVQQSPTGVNSRYSVPPPSSSQNYGYNDTNYDDNYNGSYREKSQYTTEPDYERVSYTKVIPPPSVPVGRRLDIAEGDLRSRLSIGNAGPRQSYDGGNIQPIPTVSSLRSSSPAPHHIDQHYNTQQPLSAQQQYYSKPAADQYYADAAPAPLAKSNSAAGGQQYYMTGNTGGSYHHHHQQEEAVQYCSAADTSTAIKRPLSKKQRYRKVTRKSTTGEVIFIKRIPVDENGIQNGEAIIEYDREGGIGSSQQQQRQVVSQPFYSEDHGGVVQSAAALPPQSVTKRTITRTIVRAAVPTNRMQ